MQLSIAFLFAFTATLVSSQSISSLVAELPSCAVSCLASASSTVGCGISDYACQCGAQKSALTKAATPCVLKACSTSDALKTNSITGQICKAAVTGPQTSIQYPGGSMVSSIMPGGPKTSSTPTTYTTIPATYSTATVKPTPVENPTGGASAPAATATPSTPVTAGSSRVQGGMVAAGVVMIAAFAL